MPKNKTKTPDNLEELLRKAAQQKMSPEERREQRVSFVMGTLPMDSSITKDEVRAILRKNYG